MTLTEQILAAFALDLLLGDPRRLPHPVRLMGQFAMKLEEPCRKAVSNERLAGVLAAVTVVSVSAAAAALFIAAAGRVSPVLGDLASVFLLYCGIAARDMIRHSHNVFRALEAGDLPQARRGVGMICGRDTDELDEEAAARATVESVAENTVDGVISPLFYAALGGPVALMAYKAVSTLDSTFGYKNERYLHFGWASARLDDIANFIPARITGLLTPLAARILGLNAVGAWRIFLRDRFKHPSPNAGQAEAAVAGALDARLGGLSHYGGAPSNKPTLGDPVTLMAKDKILQANALLMVTSGLALALFLAVRAVVL